MYGRSARLETAAPEKPGAPGQVALASQRAVPERVLIVSQWFWPELIGTGFYSGDLGFWLAERGSSVEALTNRPNYPGPKVFPDYRDGRRDREEERGVALHWWLHS
jgi:colanic acid biosynthesis glycosyl transferase WcaI